MTALSKEENELRNVHREFELAESKVAAWLINGKHNEAFGKIIVRYTKRASIVSVLIYEIDDAANYAPALGATEIMTGCGYDRTAEGISRVLWKLRAELAKWHGIRFNCSETARMRTWEQEFEKNGYTVIRVL